MHSTTFHVNWDALLARVVYRWHWRLALGVLLLCAAGGLATGLVPPVWRGTALLTVSAPAGAVIEVDGRSWPRTLYAGEHTVTARLPDGRRSWASISLPADEPLNLALPQGLTEPVVRSLPLAAPGARIERVEWANGAWRATSGAIPLATATGLDATSATPTPAPSHTIAWSTRGTERLSTIDAYGGLADQLLLDGQLLEAVYRPGERSFGTTDEGAVEVRGWQKATATIPLSAELTLLRFAPDGASLLFAERITGGEQISVAERGHPPVPVVAVPGRVVRTAWSDDGGSVVLHSQLGERLSLTLVRLRPTLAAATVAEIDTATDGGLVPLTWSPDSLLWIAPDPTGESMLWEAPLQSLIPSIRGRLDARAIGYQRDGSLRVLAPQSGRLVIGLYRDGVVVGQAFVPDIAASDSLAGIWRGDELLVQDDNGTWLVSSQQ